MRVLPHAAHRAAPSDAGPTARRPRFRAVAMQGDADSTGEAGKGPHRTAPPGKMSEASWPDKPDRPRRPPRTPDRLADDIRRNDFMLRAAVVLLALLMACTTIVDSAVLVHIRAGEYMAGHGVLPPRTDVFSYAADGLPWINLAWLFDLASAGVYGLAGAVGLSVLKALMAAVTFALVLQVSRPGVPTWWGSVCAALALLVCVPQFSATPELVTLLGVALVLWVLHRWRQQASTNVVWGLVPVMWLWSQLDPRAFLGLALLVLYGLGEALGAWLGQAAVSDRRRRWSLWMATGASLLASLIHPFGWHVWISPAVLYGTVYPAQRSAFEVGTGTRLPTAALQYFPMTSGVFWRSAATPHVIAALVLVAAVVVVFLLNRRRLPISHLLLALGFAGFALAGSHELAAASLVWCALATVNAQEWYRESFRQAYSPDRGQRVFSLGGRVVTLLGLCVLAYLSISGRLLGAGGPRTGFGFQPALRASIESLGHALATVRAEDNGFNYRRAQGDAMIWLGHKPFLDNRVALHARGGAESVLARHQAVRRALQGRPQTPSRFPQGRAAWRKTLDAYGVRYALPDLGGFDPRYQPFWALYGSPDWIMTHLDAATAVFYRLDTRDPALERWLARNRVIYTEQAFDGRAERIPASPAWTDFDAPGGLRLILPQRRRPNAVQQALHYDEIARQMMQQALRQQRPVLSPVEAAVAHLAVRSARRGLAADPSNAAAYAVLGDAYFVLENVERGWVRPSAQPLVRTRRFVQAAAAYGQALRAGPDGPQAGNARLMLRNLHLLHENYDLALQAAEGYAASVTDPSELSDAGRGQFEQNDQLMEALRKQVRQALTTVEVQLEHSPDHLAAGLVAQQQGCVRRALEEWDKVPADQLPPAQRVEFEVQRALILLKMGRAGAAYQRLGALEHSGLSEPARMSANWRSATALAALSVGQYDQATLLWEAELDALQTQRFSAVFDTLPLASHGTEFFGTGLWSPISQIHALQFVLPALDERSAQTRLQIALCHLETGNVAAAEAALRTQLDATPETILRPLTATYLTELSHEFIDFFPPSERIPIFPDMFAEEPPVE